MSLVQRAPRLDRRTRGATRVEPRAAIAALGLAGLLAAGLAIAVAAAAAPSSLVPSSRAGFPGWLAGPFALAGGRTISPGAFGALLLGMSACYLAVLAVADAVRARWALAAVLGAHAVFLLAPPLLTTDVFGYLAYARTGALHGLNPYLHGTGASGADPVRAYAVWDRPATPYGPLFTLGSYLLAPLGLPVGLWALKAVATGASLGCVALVWQGARRLGRAPVPAALFLGLNPLLLVYAVGGAHNDLLMMIGVLAGVLLLDGGRPAAGGAALVAAAAVKAAGLVVLPFALVASRRPGRAIAGAAVAAAAIAGMALAVLGPGTLHAAAALGAQGRLSSLHSVPSVVGRLLGLGGASAGAELAAAVGLGAALAALLVRAWRGLEVVVAAGWALLALLAATPWLMPWYAVWALPLAALGSSRPLRIGALALCGFMLATRISLPSV